MFCFFVVLSTSFMTCRTALAVLGKFFTNRNKKDLFFYLARLKCLAFYVKKQSILFSRFFFVA